MSDNGPFTQPPQYPGGEGNNSGGQQPYGGYGQPGPGDPNAQYPGGYSPGGYPSGGQPGYQQGGAYGTGPQYPQDQAMYQGGGQPPYPGGGAPGGGYPPPKKSSAGLWIVIAGGAVILVLVVAVVVMLLRNGGEKPPTTAGGGGEQGTEQGGGNEPEPEPEGGEGAPKGEAPYALPEDACKALTESQAAEYGAEDGSKNLSDSRSTCSWSISGEDGGYGTLRIEYETPYGGSDSIEGAKSDYEDAVKMATDEESSYMDKKVLKEQDVDDLGQEAKLVFSEQKSVGNQSVGELLIRQDNVNIMVSYSMSGSLLEENAPAPLEFSDIEKTVPELGKLAVDHLGA